MDGRHRWCRPLRGGVVDRPLFNPFFNGVNGFGRQRWATFGHQIHVLREQAFDEQAFVWLSRNQASPGLSPFDELSLAGEKEFASSLSGLMTTDAVPL